VATAPAGGGGDDWARGQEAKATRRRLDQAAARELQRATPPSSAATAGGLRSLQLALTTEQGRRVVLRSGVAASPLFYAQAIRINWFVDRMEGPHVVAVGQCVLARGTLTVDGPQRRATWTTG
jgi:hypothetical protein